LSGITLTIDGLDLAAYIDARVEARLAGTEDDPLLDAEEAAEYLHVSRQRVYDLTAQGRLQRVGAKGTRLLVRRSELDRFLAGRAS
jgi:excisionase family DNA binding protein